MLVTALSLANLLPAAPLATPTVPPPAPPASGPGSFEHQLNQATTNAAPAPAPATSADKAATASADDAETAPEHTPAAKPWRPWLQQNLGGRRAAASGADPSAQGKADAARAGLAAETDPPARDMALKKPGADADNLPQATGVVPADSAALAPPTDDLNAATATNPLDRTDQKVSGEPLPGSEPSAPAAALLPSAAAPATTPAALQPSVIMPSAPPSAIPGPATGSRVAPTATAQTDRVGESTTDADNTVIGTDADSLPSARTGKTTGAAAGAVDAAPSNSGSSQRPAAGNARLLDATTAPDSSQPGSADRTSAQAEPETFAAALARQVDSMASAVPAPAPAAAAASARLDNSARTPAGSVDVQVPAGFGSPEFAHSVGQQISLLASDGVQHARLHLHPAEMGPITVQITLDGATAQVNLTAENALTRQALEQAMPNLASNLRDSGLTLTGGGVFEQPQQARDPSGTDGRGSPGSQQRAGFGSERAGQPAPPTRGLPRQGVVDLYA